MRFIVSLLALCLMGFNASAYAADDIWGREKPDDGWFWYKKTPEPEPEQKPKEQESKPSGKSDKEKKPMSVAWMRKMLPILQDRANDNPTKENLEALFYVQRVMLDKSQRFQEEAKKVVESDMMLDENNRVPLSAYGKNEFMGKEFKSKESALKYLAKDVGGLFVFFDSKCDFCKAQVRILNYMQESYGFNVKYISMDGKGLPGIKDWVPDNGHAKMLNLKVYPTTVFVAPPKTYLLVSQGMMAKDQLGERILQAAMGAKLLPDSMEKDVNPWDRGVLTVDDMQDGASENPEEFVKYIQEKLKARY